jgi:hypothetical protein
MILKEPDNHKIHRLRVLHPFEADYNLILGVKWRQLMRHAKEHQTENGLILRSVTSEVTSGLRLYPGSYELRVTRTSGFRCENIELWEKV